MDDQLIVWGNSLEATFRKLFGRSGNEREGRGDDDDGYNAAD